MPAKIRTSPKYSIAEMARRFDSYYGGPGWQDGDWTDSVRREYFRTDTKADWDARDLLCQVSDIPTYLAAGPNQVSVTSDFTKLDRRIKAYVEDPSKHTEKELNDLFSCLETKTRTLSAPRTEDSVTVTPAEEFCRFYFPIWRNQVREAIIAHPSAQIDDPACYQSPYDQADTPDNMTRNDSADIWRATLDASSAQPQTNTSQQKPHDGGGGAYGTNDGGYIHGASQFDPNMIFADTLPVWDGIDRLGTGFSGQSVMMEGAGDFNPQYGAENHDGGYTPSQAGYAPSYQQNAVDGVGYDRGNGGYIQSGGGFDPSGRTNQGGGYFDDAGYWHDQ